MNTHIHNRSLKIFLYSCFSFFVPDGPGQEVKPREEVKVPEAADCKLFNVTFTSNLGKTQYKESGSVAPTQVHDIMGWN